MSEPDAPANASDLAARLAHRDAELDALVDGNPYGVTVLDPQGRYVRVNAATVKALGYPASAMLGRRPAEFVSIEGRAAVDADVARVLRGETVSFTARYVRRDGTPLHVAGRAVPIAVDGEISGALVFARDVGDERGLTLAVDAHGERLQALYRLATSPTATADRQIGAALRLGADHFGLGEGFVALAEGDVLAVPHRTLPQAELDTALIRRVTAVPGDDVLCVERGGQAYVLTPIDADGVRLGALGFHGPGPLPQLGRADRDLVRLIGALIASALLRSRSRARLDAVVLNDRLTGLPSAVLLDERLERAMRAHRRTKQPFAVHLIDLDAFSAINDRHGRRAGDALLRVVATRLRDTVRETDTVARLGGDAFAVLQSDLAGGGSDVLARRLGERIAEPVVLDGTIVRITASIGVARAPEDGDDGRALLARADDRCRDVKTTGRAAVSSDETIRTTR